MRPWFEGSVLISQASTVFDSNGRVVDAGVQDRIRTFVEGFAAFVESQRPSRLVAAPDVTAGHPSNPEQRAQYQHA
jgi:hypothetical protein